MECQTDVFVTKSTKGWYEPLVGKIERAPTWRLILACVGIFVLFVAGYGLTYAYLTTSGLCCANLLTTIVNLDPAIMEGPIGEKRLFLFSSPNNCFLHHFIYYKVLNKKSLDINVSSTRLSIRIPNDEAQLFLCYTCNIHDECRILTIRPYTVPFRMDSLFFDDTDIFSALAPVSATESGTAFVLSHLFAHIYTMAALGVISCLILAFCIVPCLQFQRLRKPENDL